jgi:hypothetical protein
MASFPSGATAITANLGGLTGRARNAADARSHAGVTPARRGRYRLQEQSTLHRTKASGNIGDIRWFAATCPKEVTARPCAPLKWGNPVQGSEGSRRLAFELVPQTLLLTPYGSPPCRSSKMRGMMSGATLVPSLQMFIDLGHPLKQSDRACSFIRWICAI